MPGIFMPRAFIIAMASGGIWGMFAISMVVVTFHRPGLPCGAASTDAGARASVAMAIPQNLRGMAFSRLQSRQICHARHAFALQASGQVEAARTAARQAWLAGAMPRADEDRLLAQLGNALLVCATETRTAADVEAYAATLAETLKAAVRAA